MIHQSGTTVAFYSYATGRRVGTGESLGELKLQQTMILSEAGETRRPNRLTVTDSNGNVISIVDGSVQAKRINVEPLN